MKQLTSINSGELAIFKAALEGIDGGEPDPNLFTDWFLKSKTSGTWWKPGSDRKLISDGYDRLRDEWNKAGKPRAFYTDDTMRDEIIVHFDENKEPIFHHRHGFRFDDVWQRQFCNSKKKTVVVVGGMGSGKTLAAVAKTLILAAILPGFKAFFIAPYMAQAKALKEKAIDLIRGTLYEKKFLIGHTQKPPTITIGNELVGINTIECIAILDDPEKIKNLEGDMAVIDQAEMLDINDDFKANVISRLRGYDIQSGREKLGLTVYIANANSDVPSFWALVDEAQGNPEVYDYFAPKSQENIYLSDTQLNSWRTQFAKTPEMEAMYFEGKRVWGQGKYFPASIVERNWNRGLDQKMENGLANGIPGYRMERAKNLDTYLWETPYDPTQLYITIADPGWDNPPSRNSPVIMALNVTDFPNRPAHIAAFNWVFGNGEPGPWLAAFKDYNTRYNTIGRGYYDATGHQRGYEHFNRDLALMGANKVDMAGGMKDITLTGLRTILANGLLHFPDITYIRAQILKYDLPDTDLAQDIIACLCVSTVYFSPWLIKILREANKGKEKLRDRNARPSKSRNQRSGGRRR